MNSKSIYFNFNRYKAIIKKINWSLSSFLTIVVVKIKIKITKQL
jgi:hypothetical protein